MKDKQSFLHFLNVLIKAAALAAVITVLVVAGILFFREFFSGLIERIGLRNPINQSSQSSPSSPAISNQPSVPLPAPDGALQGSFTELFSGVGWKNEKNSTAYQDEKTTVISFAPVYDLKEVSALGEGLKGESLIAAKSNGREVVLVAKSGKIFKFASDNGPGEEIRVNPLLSSSENQRPSASMLRSALLDYDDAKQTWVVAAVSENGDALIGPIGSIVPITPTGPIGGLACANGECLVIFGSNIYRFAENNPSALIRVDIRVSPLLSQENPRESASNDIRVNPLLSIGKAGNTLLVGIVEKIGNTYTGNIFKYSGGASPEPLAKAGGSLIRVNPLLSSSENPRQSASMFSSPYSGTIRFGYNAKDGELLVVYAAYIGQAYKFRVSPLLSSSENQRPSASIVDYSLFFSQRIIDGHEEGAVSVIPEIFFKDGVWWFGATYDSPQPKVFRIENGVGSDLTEQILSSLSSSCSSSSCPPSFSKLFLVPGFSVNQVYIIGVDPRRNPRPSASIYRLTSNGFETKNKIVWESINLNPWDAGIVSARIFRAEGGIGEDVIKNDPRESASIIRFYLSNNGGKNWTPAKFGETVNFSTKGKDLRFKIEMSPSGDKSRTPWLDTFGVEYVAAPDK